MIIKNSTIAIENKMQRVLRQMKTFTDEKLR